MVRTDTPSDAQSSEPPAPVETHRSLTECLHLLEHLGSCFTIAHYLGQQGITGWRYQSEDSALARWIRWETGALRVEIDDEEVWLVMPDDKSVSEWKPTVVADFERRFDRGEFPHLVARGVRK